MNEKQQIPSFSFGSKRMSASAFSLKKQKRVENLFFLLVQELPSHPHPPQFQHMWQTLLSSGLSCDPALNWSPIRTTMAAPLHMHPWHLEPDTKWMIAMIKLPFNYSMRCQWCMPLWHYNGLRLPRRCQERQGTITLSKCWLPVTLFPVHQLIFQVVQNSRVRCGAWQGSLLGVILVTQGFG